MLESLYIPEEPIEYLRWSIVKLDVDGIKELTYHDYSSNVFVSVEDFEELFYYIDIAIRFCRRRSDTKDEVYPWNSKNMTLIEMRHGCKRTYENFKELISIFKIKTLELLEAIDNCDDADKYYTIKRWRGLIHDLSNVIDALNERSKR